MRTKQIVYDFIKKCGICGVEFRTNKDKQSFCSEDCREAQRLKLRREKYRMNKS
jgi:predicted nucleic acid-binding Zn ribbon protein